VPESVHRAAGRARATVLGAALLTGTVLPAAGLWAGSASAAPTCVTSAGVTTCTFSYTGSATSWPVPAGVTTLTVVADGGAGANATSTYFNGGGNGGRGGETRATLTGVPASTTLSVFPGGAGSGSTGGTDAGLGGGNGASDILGNISGGGGGASTVYLTSVSPGNLLVAAGGGGGGGAENFTSLTPANGGNGGGSGVVNGRDGNPVASPTRGRGGTTLAGGADGGTLGCTLSAGPGVQGGGGRSNHGVCGLVGGGGGSGFFGGGGAANFAGGGGGSAFPAASHLTGAITVSPDSTDANTRAGNGVVTISYVPLTPTTTTLSSSRNPSVFGQSVTFTAVVSPTDGGGSVRFKNGASTISGCSAQSLHLIGGQRRAFCTTSSLPAGSDSITAVYSGDSHFLGSTGGPLIQHVLRAPTNITPDLVFNSQQTFTVLGTLRSFGHPLPGQVLTFRTGTVFLCAAVTGGQGTASCQLSYAKSIAIRQNAGRYQVSYSGSPSYLPSFANGQAIIQP
jgi:hypothetical protein